MSRPITAADRPDYDGWGPDSHWSCEDWIAWHRALAAHHGVELADDIWANAWLDGVSRLGGGRGAAPGSGHVFDSVPVRCRTFDSRFAQYVAARPKLAAAVWTGLGGAMMAPVSSAAEAARNVGQGMWTLSQIHPAWLLFAAAAVVYLKHREK